MNCTEAGNISKYLRTKEIQLPSNNKWLLDCINWYKSHLELKTIYSSLQDYVLIQWLLSDLREVQNQCLPTNCKNNVVTELTGKYCVQVNWVRDISQPCYTQLQAMKNKNIADSNDNVSAEENKKQNWEPSPKRVLMMEVTDGFTTLKAMEHSPIPKLMEPFIPGFKVVLIGPIECRKGILFLKNSNISILGGEVDYMSDMYSKENILSRCLNIAPPVNNVDDRGRNTSPAPPSPPLVHNEPQLSNDADQLPDSTSFIETNPYEDNYDAMMGYGDDDEIFMQLPEIDDTDNFNQNSNRLPPVVDEDSREEVQSSTLENSPEDRPVHSTAKNPNRPKLFPSMEDLRPGKELSSSIKQSTLTTIVRQSTETEPKASSSRIASSINLKALKTTNDVSENKELHVNKPESLRRVPSVSSTAVEKRPMKPDLKLENLNDSISNQIDKVLDETGDENIYPQFKRVNVKVLSITKLKIRNGEWNCCASVSIEDKNENVTFCNKMLEKLFGTSAAEVEVLRSEMAKNQSLKEKINDILKMGQTKLKLLNCLMIVEYTSEGCTPNIVSIHED